MRYIALSLLLILNCSPAWAATVNVVKYPSGTPVAVCLPSDSNTSCGGTGTGTVTGVSVVSANGFAGTSSGGPTPALTLSTTITGILKGNGTAISAASAGTDYQLPYWSISGSTLSPSSSTYNVKLNAGTTSLAPLVFKSGTNLTTPTAGSMEYDGSNFYLSGLTRETIALYPTNQATSHLSFLALGADTNYSVTGTGNLGLGYNALNSLTTGIYNTAIGYHAGYQITGNYNTIVGGASMYSSGSGSYNDALGVQALYSVTSGGGNDVFGYQTLENITTGNNNVAIGYQAGKYYGGSLSVNTTGSLSVLIGYSAEPLNDGDSNEIVFGDNVVGNGSNTATFGNVSITDNYFNGKVHSASENLSSLTASKVVFTDASKNLTSTGIGTSSQFIKGDGSLDSTTYLSSLSGALLATGATTGATSQAQAFTDGITTTTNSNSSDSSTQGATDAFVQNAVNLSMATMPLNLGVTGGGIYSFATQGTVIVFNYTASGAITSINSILTHTGTFAIGDIVTVNSGNHDAMIIVTAVSSGTPTAVSILYGGTGYTSSTSGASIPSNTIPFTFILSGALTSDATFIMQHGTYLTQSNQWIFANNTTGPYTLTVCVAGTGDSCSGGRTVAVPQGTNNSKEIFIQTDGELNVDVADAGSQTPWTSNIDGATYNLTNAGSIQSDELLGVNDSNNYLFYNSNTGNGTSSNDGNIYFLSGQNESILGGQMSLTIYANNAPSFPGETTNFGLGIITSGGNTLDNGLGEAYFGSLYASSFSPATVITPIISSPYVSQLDIYSASTPAYGSPGYVHITGADSWSQSGVAPGGEVRITGGIGDVSQNDGNVYLDGGNNLANGSAGNGNTYIGDTQSGKTFIPVAGMVAGDGYCQCTDGSLGYCDIACGTVCNQNGSSC